MRVHTERPGFFFSLLFILFFLALLENPFRNSCRQKNKITRIRNFYIWRKKRGSVCVIFCSLGSWVITKKKKIERERESEREKDRNNNEPCARRSVYFFPVSPAHPMRRASRPFRASIPAYCASIYNMVRVCVYIHTYKLNVVSRPYFDKTDTVCAVGNRGVFSRFFHAATLGIRRRTRLYAVFVVVGLTTMKNIL